MKEKIAVAFSGGKDSVMMLHRLMEENQYEIACLITTVTDADQKTTSHKVDTSLLELQAQSIGIPLRKMVMSSFTAAEFEEKYGELMTQLKQEGITKIAYGDLFLEDVKEYKEELFARHGFSLILPLWKENSKELAESLVSLGYKAMTVCVDTAQLSDSFLGRLLTQEFFEALPPKVDVCGENGEYHSFVYDGPIFSFPVQFKVQEEDAYIDGRWRYKQLCTI
ncbi:diphthine--ammonia ligase [Bacillus sp. 165]|uniref:Dph6-related ATP pyrophosphatase n=1 Tax=Bacillus sp. 165 TaxID=1529117 RepID=UPI001ADCE995|nr:diphthine--ammonia ligase [Bacillus sp. 165]MBO9128110.1 diphthine--ammonia ligase [Bacillus sp. 165]